VLHLGWKQAYPKKVGKNEQEKQKIHPNVLLDFSKALSSSILCKQTMIYHQSGSKRQEGMQIDGTEYYCHSCRTVSRKEGALMLDPSTLIPWISPIITAVIMYIKTQGAQKAGDKAAEVIGEKATEMTMSTGQKALTLLRSRFSAKADRKAQQALANVEQDPNDDD